MKNKHYVVLPLLAEEGQYRVVCLAHDVSNSLKRSEADALANALNLQSCHQQVGFGE